MDNRQFSLGEFKIADTRLSRIGMIVPSSNTNAEPDCLMLAPPGVTIHTTRSGGYDVALVQLETSVPEALTPATLYTGKNELGATGTSVGFGVTGTGLTGAITSDDENRAGLNVIESESGAWPLDSTSAIYPKSSRSSRSFARA